MQAVGVDLGSNTLRAVLLGDDDSILWEYEGVVGMAEGFSKQPIISPHALQRLHDCMCDMHRAFLNTTGKHLKDFPILAVATAAMRKAANRNEVLAMFRKMGIVLHIIDTTTEALFTLNAALFAMKRVFDEIQPFVLLDIGGASTEISLHSGGGHYVDVSRHDDFHTKSFDIGIITLHEYDTDAIQHVLADMKYSLLSWLQQYDTKPSVFVASGGVPFTIASILGHKRGYKRDEITTACVAEARDYFLKLSIHEKQSIVGKRREHLIETGMDIFNAFFDALRMHKCIVVEESLREGAALHVKYFS